MKKRNRIKLSESQLHRVISESVRVILEDYGKWFQTEENDIHQVIALMKQLKQNLANIDSLPKNEVWEVVRQLGYINHSAFKVKRGMWDLYPDEELELNDYRLNKLVYSFKEKALKVLVDYYLNNGLDVSANEKGDSILFRDPMTGVRQITFHVGDKLYLTEPIESKNGEWDGVRQSHHYTNDEDYLNMRNRQN